MMGLNIVFVIAVRDFLSVGYGEWEGYMRGHVGDVDGPESSELY